jgi:hypothetical protein
MLRPNRRAPPILIRIVEHVLGRSNVAGPWDHIKTIAESPNALNFVLLYLVFYSWHTNNCSHRMIRVGNPFTVVCADLKLAPTDWAAEEPIWLRL